jgi:NTP pyrophosphatase (non-canonical NTP hydrolase)
MKQFRNSDAGVTKEFLTKMRSFFGDEKNLDQMIEECGELIVAIQHYKRGRISPDEVAIEIADVIMMADQLRMIIGPDLVDLKLMSQVLVVEKRYVEGIDGEGPHV